MKTVILLILLPFFATSQHAISTRNELTPLVPANITLCQSCCSINDVTPYKASIQHYDNENTVSGTAQSLNLPAPNYYLLWENDGTQFDTIWGNQGQGHIFRKKDANGNWYFPQWLVNIEPKGLAGGGGAVQHYVPQNTQSIHGETQILLTKDDAGDYQSACLYRNGKHKYGYWEARIKITDVKKGTFPTFWLFSGGCNEDNPSNYAEIDICDFAFKNNYKYGISAWESQSSAKCECYAIYGTQIHPSMKVGNWYKNIDFSQDYFIYGVDWRPDSIIFYLNRDRMLATPNIVNNAAVRSIFELKVKGGWEPLLNPNSTLIYHIDWVKYYKRKEDMNLMLVNMPTQACISKDLSFALNDFVEGAYFTCTGLNGTYTSPPISAQNVPPTNFPANIPAIYPTFDFGNRAAWNVFVNIHIPTTCITGKYTITMHIPNVPESDCPTKDIVIIDTLPPPPTDIIVETKGSNIIDYKCIFSVEPNKNDFSYKWNIDSVASKPIIVLKNAGTYHVTISAVNSCGVSMPYTETITCDAPYPCDNCEMYPYFFSPNPTSSGCFFIESMEKISCIELYDVNGKRVFHEEKASTLAWEICIYGLTQGIYQVVLYGEKKVFYGKIVISK